MYVIIVGGGKVGYYLTKTLVNEGYEVLLIERKPQKVATFTERFGAVVLQGDGAEVATLDKAGAARADVVVAVTGEDEDNLVICQVAKAALQRAQDHRPRQQPQERADLPPAGHRRRPSARPTSSSTSSSRRSPTARWST